MKERERADLALRILEALSRRDRTALEVIVRTSGRPALRFVDGLVEVPDDLIEDPDNDLWRALIATESATIARNARSVGRIDRLPPGAPPEPIGTGWRLGSELIVTNRHVLRHLVENREEPVSAWRMNAEIPSIVDLDPEHPDEARQFMLKSVGWCSPEPTLDLAFIVMHLGDRTPPPALPLCTREAALGRTLATDPPAFEGKKVYVIGHPHQLEGTDATADVFGDVDGSKRFAPGYVTVYPDAQVPAVFRHDCSTLGGNSGSPVFSEDYHEVVGVHFGGYGGTITGSGNGAIAIERLKGSRPGEILEKGAL